MDVNDLLSSTGIAPSVNSSPVDSSQVAPAQIPSVQGGQVVQGNANVVNEPLNVFNKSNVSSNMDLAASRSVDNVPSAENKKESEITPAAPPLQVQENEKNEVKASDYDKQKLTEDISSLEDAIKQVINSAPDQREISNSVSAPIPNESTKAASDLTPVESPKLISNTISNSSKFPFTLDQLLDIVVKKNASDLHISVGYPITVRVDGDLEPISADIVSDEVAKNLIYAALNENIKEVVEVNKEADLAYAYKNIARFRVNVFHALGNLAAAFRLIPNKIRTLEELKLPKIYGEFVNLRQGLILVTGPTGHGKSTTLAGIINQINLTKPVHIVTIEDPVEYVYPKGQAVVDQREIKNDTHGWDIALRSILRQDPDVVLIGEMRDFETISAAITVAETGHLVFATLHTNSAAQTVDRIIDVFPEHQQAQVRSQLATVIEGIVAQRLVKLIGGGRRAVSEVMLGTPAVRNIIREGKTYQLDNVIRTGGDVGMLSMEKSLVDLVREGLITVEDAQSYAVHPEEVVRLLR